MQLLCLSLVVMRCQPLRRALCSFLGNKNQHFQLALEFALLSCFDSDLAFGNVCHIQRCNCRFCF
ncbi:acetyltransferase [Vibrio cholerae]|nr:acetyltransferase [Vibrio cholerae]